MCESILCADGGLPQGNGEFLQPLVLSPQSCHASLGQRRGPLKRSMERSPKMPVLGLAPYHHQVPASRHQLGPRPKTLMAASTCGLQPSL